MTYKIGVVGLGVMGANLARNIAGRGFPVAGYDLDAAKTKAFASGQSESSGIGSADAPDRLMAVLERPRRVLVMVPAGPPVDSVIAHLRPHLQPDDILIDGGNSYFRDTDRRADDLAAAGFRFVGMGVSGGEEGALRGPSMMPGGPRKAWDALAPILRAMAAKAEDGDPCVAYMGPRGAGHYVKMVHNGIEYGDMQLIAEIYDLLGRGAGLSAPEIAEIFSAWNDGELRSYLIEITARVLERADEKTGRPLVDVILDEAQQKGTGKWMSQNAFDVGAPIPTVNAAVEARLLSALKSERVLASTVLKGPMAQGPTTVAQGFSPVTDRKRLIEACRQALYACKVTSYAQGMAMLRQASQEYGYEIDPGEVARIWRAGCIIRAALLSDVRAAFANNSSLVNLMLDPGFSSALAERQQGWRDVVQTAIALGIPVPALSASLAYYDSYRTARLPANLTQGQRDFFGAHTYRRVDADGVFHTEWTHK
ncbi:MAG TPA: NADP-dependent phosphogluconate dehydrogenase [Vicinamibacterales bacterium]|nr:NADP-dependent phosphogluconate dehydrogenase [Vicinamibacterales bacterium]